jgi:hypothetical protein
MTSTFCLRKSKKSGKYLNRRSSDAANSGREAASAEAYART